MSKKKTKENKKTNISKKKISEELKKLKNVGDETIIRTRNQHHIILFPKEEYYYIFNNKTTDETYKLNDLIIKILSNEK